MAENDFNLSITSNDINYVIPPKEVDIENVAKNFGVTINNNALNDAYYTAEILKKICNKSFQPVIYNPNYIKPNFSKMLK